MQSGMKIFEREEFGTVRVVEYNGEPWFVASDVARILGYERPNDAVSTHCKKVNKFSYGDAPKGAQPYNIIPESDVYRLVMRSHLTKAVEFQDWVVEDVLPSIRKTGGYSMAGAKAEREAPIQGEVEAAILIFKAAGIQGNQLALAADKYYKRRIGVSALESAGLELVAPQQKQLLTPTQIGRELGGISGRKVNLMLAGLGLQQRVGDAWEPTEEGTARGGVLMDTGKRHGDGTPVRQLKWPSDVVAVLQ